MNDKLLEELLDELLTNRITAEAAKVFVSLIDEPESRAKLEAIMEARFVNGHYEISGDLLRQEAIKKLLLEKINKPNGSIIRMFIRYAAAAVFILVIAGTYLLLNNNHKPTILLSQAERFKNDVAPGKTGAVLSIEGGKTILLDTAANGQILGHFTKGDKALTVASTEVQYALLSTPIARTEVLNLSDGSTVWLNAASSIRFPTVFAGSERVVEVTGEVYFKVAHNANIPFKVKVAGQVIEDIGTEFNINAYDNERVLKTTLVEGAVKVVANGNILLLKPGQQSESDQTGNLKQVAIFDMDETLAWKDGLFTYNGASMEAIMRQVARWYGVEVVYGDKVAGEFVADIPREVPVSKLLSVLEGTGKVHFTIEGKKITVLK